MAQAPDQSFAQSIASAVDAQRSLGCQDVAQADNAGSQGQHVVVEGAGVTEGVGSGGIESGHDVRAAAERTERETTTDVLADRHHVRGDTQHRLQSAGCEARGHDFVEDQDDAVPGGGLAHRAHEFVAGANAPAAANHGLHDHRGQFAGVCFDQRQRAFDVVVGRHHIREGRIHGCGVAAETQHAAVVAAFESHDRRPACGGAGGAQGVQVGFGAGVGKAHQLEGREALAEQVGKFRLAGRRSAQHDALLQGLDHRRLDERVGVAIQARGLLGHGVDVTMPVEIGDLASLAASEGQRKRRVVEYGARVAAGHVKLRSFEGRIASGVGRRVTGLGVAQGGRQVDVAAGRVHAEFR